MKILSNNNKNFDKELDDFLSKRKKKLQSENVSVTKIIKDVKRNGDKALLKYERRFNNNNIIIPSIKQINKSIKSLDKKVKKQLMMRIKEFTNFILYKNLKIFHIEINIIIRLIISIYLLSRSVCMCQGLPLHILRPF